VGVLTAVEAAPALKFTNIHPFGLKKTLFPGCEVRVQPSTHLGC